VPAGRARVTSAKSWRNPADPASLRGRIRHELPENIPLRMTAAEADDGLAHRKQSIEGARELAATMEENALRRGHADPTHDRRLAAFAALRIVAHRREELVAARPAAGRRKRHQPTRDGEQDDVVADPSLGLVGEFTPARADIDLEEFQTKQQRRRILHVDVEIR